jgi:hypothetical protein
MLKAKQVTKLSQHYKNKGYCQINNALHFQLKEYLSISSKLLSQTSIPELNDPSTEVVTTKGNNSFILTSPFIGESLLIYFTKIYSQIADKNLIPTYSFYRKYHKTNTLEKHTDRPSCQYSATIQIDSSENTSWPIWIKDKMGKDIKCDTKVGDIVFYRGEEVPHWREELQYDYSSHLFLHWVDREDPNYQPYWFDGRERLGISR